MTGPSRSDGSGVKMPRMRPCAVEMTGTVCCADEEARQEMERPERRREGSREGKDGRGGGGEGDLLGFMTGCF